MGALDRRELRLPANRAQLEQQCPQLAAADGAHVQQRWLLLSRLNVELEALVAHVHTGWAEQPHTLGARICALRELVFHD
eukprot:2921863-Pleurochrysis_carterae.AAC.1